MSPEHQAETPEEQAESPAEQAESPGLEARRERAERKREKAERKREKAERKRQKLEQVAQKRAGRPSEEWTVETAPEKRYDFFDRAPRFTELVAVETEYGAFLVRTDDSNVGRSLFGKKDRGEFRVLGKGMSVLEHVGQAESARAGLFMDVGANIGTTTVAALHANGFSRAVALEPEPRNQRLLGVNIALNGFADRVQTFAYGVSDAPGKARLLVVEDKSGTHEVAVPANEKGADGDGRHLIDIELVTLDSLVESSVLEADGRGLLWIDTEGHEGQVLAGAGRLLAEGVPVILEVSPRKLRKQGGTDLLIDAAQEHYTQFVDMRHVRGLAGKGDDMQPVSALRGLIDELVEAAASHTEVLFVRER